MNKKYLAAFLCCFFLAPFIMLTSIAQEPVTFTDEDGEVVTYGEEKEWVRTILFVFPDNHYNDYSIYQTTKGNEVWITTEDGHTEYHIGNNGECGWEEVNVPQINGYETDLSVIPEVDLYYHPEKASESRITVTYTRLSVLPKSSVTAESEAVPQGTDEENESSVPAVVASSEPTIQISAPADSDHESRREMSWYLYAALAAFIVLVIAGGTILISKLIHSSPEDEVDEDGDGSDQQE